MWRDDVDQAIDAANGVQEIVKHFTNWEVFICILLMQGYTRREVDELLNLEDRCTNSTVLGMRKKLKRRGIKLTDLIEGDEVCRKKTEEVTTLLYHRSWIP